MVATPVLADLLNGRDVLGFLDHADKRRVAALIAADPALILLGHVAAGAAELDPLDHLEQHQREPPYVGRIGRQQEERDALGTLGPDAGQRAQLVDEVLNNALVHRRAFYCSPGKLPGSSPGPGMPGSPGSPPPPKPEARGPIASCCSSAAAREASRIAASTRSARVCAVSAGSDGSMASGAMTRSRSSPWPLTTALTRPPPAVPSTAASASSCWAFMSWLCTSAAAASSCSMSS